MRETARAEMPGRFSMVQGPAPFRAGRVRSNSGRRRRRTYLRAVEHRGGLLLGGQCLRAARPGESDGGSDRRAAESVRRLIHQSDCRGSAQLRHKHRRDGVLLGCQWQRPARYRRGVGSADAADADREPLMNDPAGWGPTPPGYCRGILATVCPCRFFTTIGTVIFASRNSNAAPSAPARSTARKLKGSVGASFTT